MLATIAAQNQSRHPGPFDLELDRVAVSGVRVKVARDAALFWEGEEAAYCYRILSGAIRTCKVLGDGRRHVGDFFMPGDLVGFDPGSEWSCTAEAVVDTVVLKFPRRAVERHIDESPRFGRTLLSLATERLGAAQSRLLLLGRKSADERIASFLLAMSSRALAAGAEEFDLPMTRTDIADYLGLTMETVSRGISSLKRSGLIALKGPQHIVILDREGLEELSEGDAE